MEEITLNPRENLPLLNPATPPAERARLLGMLDAIPDSVRAHFLILTSGTTIGPHSSRKWVALSRDALFASAEAVNRHLGCDLRDRWLHCLPDFHVGGLSIHARAELSGSKVHRLDPARKWSARDFASSALDFQATLASLVPAQVHDLVAAACPAPSSFRAILVGGGAISPSLYAQARELGWPLLPTYGMTETASQVATASIADLASSNPLRTPAMRVLSHLEVRQSHEGKIEIRGDSLLTGYIAGTSREDAAFSDPKRDGWFTTEDLGRVIDGVLEMTGRDRDRIKIGGELTNLSALNSLLDGLRAELSIRPDAAIAATPDARLESVIELVHESMPDPSARALIESFNSRVLPFERIRSSRQLDRIPRTELGKLRLSDLSREP